MVFLVGATWAFHLWMTLYVVRHNQPDIEQSGVIFSAVIIYLANLLVLGTLLVIISPELTFKDFLVDAVVRVKDVYVNVINCLTKPA
jgi:positive regulator of sigma E activity